MRILGVAVATVLVFAAPAAAGYAPVDQRGPDLVVPQRQLAAGLRCTGDVRHAARAPVLLLPAATVTSRQNFSWNYEQAFRAAQIPYCASDQPGRLATNMGDIQTRGEYVVYAIRRMYELAGRRIAVMGHSQGGMVMRWALRFWPDTRAMVEDVVGVAASNHGALSSNVQCLAGCAASAYQERAGSSFITALNSHQETFPGIDYTEVYSHLDEIVFPNLDDSGSSALHGGGGRITNVAVQDICPQDLSDHFLVGTVDRVAYALVMDALNHEAPAVVARLPAGLCVPGFMPGVDPRTVATDVAAGVTAVASEMALAPPVRGEPALRCFVTASCAPAPAAATLTRRCRATGGVLAGVTAGETATSAEFRLGSRLLKRDTTRPFSAGISRSLARRARTGRLRATVGYGALAAPLELSARLPRCHARSRP